MRLLHTKDFVLHDFYGSNIPDYVILSHTWEHEEVSYQDKLAKKFKRKKGYAKVKGSCDKAHDHGYDWMWIDTCCIDKSSSAELSEAINAMYEWYEKANICYAYLSDLDYVYDTEAFKRCRWFTRGWTLQELLAPRSVEFYNRSWIEIGTKHTLADQLSQVTGIHSAVLQGQKAISECNVGTRLSWAAKRNTTRPEDIAYCLLGLFEINMTLWYGEGEEKAFRRLQLSIMQSTDDHTLFVWQPRSPKALAGKIGLLAPSPSAFAVPLSFGASDTRLLAPLQYSGGAIIPSYSELEVLDDIAQRTQTGHHPSVTRNGIKIQLPLQAYGRIGYDPLFKALLNVRIHNTNKRVGIWLDNWKPDTLPYTRLFRQIPADESLLSLFLADEDETFPEQEICVQTHIELKPWQNSVYHIGRIQPPMTVNKDWVHYRIWREGTRYVEELPYVTQPNGSKQHINCTYGTALLLHEHGGPSKILDRLVVHFGFSKSKHNEPWCHVDVDITKDQLAIPKRSMTRRTELLKLPRGPDRVRVKLQCGHFARVAVRRTANTNDAPLYRLSVNLEM